MAASFKMAKSSFLNPMPSISSALSRTKQRANYSISASGTIKANKRPGVAMMM
jgi:hypothetical protein